MTRYQLRPSSFYEFNKKRALSFSCPFLKKHFFGFTDHLTILAFDEHLFGDTPLPGAIPATPLFITVNDGHKNSPFLIRVCRAAVFVIFCFLQIQSNSLWQNLLKIIY